MRGRPTHSQIRQNIIKILAVKKKAYGYEIAKWYNDIFPKVHIRSIYYHLKKGVETGELLLHSVKEEKGDYSWGQNAQKIYYTLGNAQVRDYERVKKYFSKNAQA